MKSLRESQFLLVGITGGIGSGKSTVCTLFGECGRLVISADDIARTLVDENQEVRNAIRKEFGSDSYFHNGSLDRARIATIVFSDASKRKLLDAIVHPHVFRTIDQQLSLLPIGKARPYVLIEAALIYETGMDETLHRVIMVTADEETCIRRVMKRDHALRKDVLQRIASQMPSETKMKQADFVIHNNGTVDEIRPTVQFLDSMLSQLNDTSNR